MTQGPNIQARLREGIDAAKQGDRLTARRLLQQVLTYERNNELALMWMASVVDTLDERRSFLQRALQVNPNNARAREALTRLGADMGSVPPPITPSESGEYIPSSSRGGNNGNVYLILAGAVAIVVAVIVGAILLNPSRSANIQPTLSDFQLTFAVLSSTGAVVDAATPTRDPRPATATVFTGVIVTHDPNIVVQLPASFTPTFTPTNTPTPLPSETPFPLSSFNILYSDFEPDAALPSLYSGSADGTNETKLESGTIGGFTDVAASPNSEQIAFVRQVRIGDDVPEATDEAGVPLPNSYPQLFIASLDDLENAQQVTSFSGEILSHPSWSPDGRFIVFTSDNDTDEEIYRLNTQTNDVIQITQNEERDFDPSYSPDGSLIIFASDFETPGFAEIYTMSITGEDVIRLTDEAGSSYSPAYSPDGTRIAFISDRQTDADLYVMDANGQRPFLITIDDNDADDRTPTWSPDSQWILFSSNREDDAYFWYSVDAAGIIERIAENDRLPQSLTFIARAP